LTPLDQMGEELARLREKLGVSPPLAEIIAACVPAIVVDLVTAEIVAATPPAEDLFEYIPGQMVGMIVHDLVPEGNLRESHKRHFGTYALNPGQRQIGKRGMLLLGRTRNGTIIEVEIGLFPRVIVGRTCVIATILPVPHRHGAGEPVKEDTRPLKQAAQ